MSKTRTTSTSSAAERVKSVDAALTTVIVSLEKEQELKKVQRDSLLGIFRHGGFEARVVKLWANTKIV